MSTNGRPKLSKKIFEQLHKMSGNLGIFRSSLQTLREKYPDDQGLDDIVNTTEMLEGVFDTWLMNAEDEYEIS